MKEGKRFLDTNILIYAFDISAGKKHETAKGIMLELWDTASGVLSTQVLQEFFVAATRKIRTPLNIKSAREIISDLQRWEIIINNVESILDAIDIQLSNRLSFWDSMIIEAAVRSGASVLYSEDLSHGQDINGVRIVNPFL